MRALTLLGISAVLLISLFLLPSAVADSGDTVEIDDVERGDGQPVELLVSLEELDRLTAATERQRQAEASQRRLVDHAISKEGIRVLNRFWITNTVLVEVTPRYDLDELTQIEGVRSLDRNTETETLHTKAHGSDDRTSDPYISTSTVTTESTTSVSTGSTTYGLEQINANEVWSQHDTKGDGVKIAVLDSGVNVTHPDIELHSTNSSDPTYPGGWAEFDSQGNLVSDSEPHDTGDHGTHVTGTAGGERTGVAPNASLMHALVIEEETGTTSQALAGLEWAVENDADVVTMSIGGPTDHVWIDAVRNANQMGTIMVSAVGNSGAGESSTPANLYDGISVGAVDSNLEVAGFSGGETVATDEMWGSDAPDDWPEEYVVPNVVAPGVEVNSTSSSGGYELNDGTSMATPHVAGAIALTLSAGGDGEPDRVREAVALKAFGSGSDGPDIRYGHGAVDALSVTEHLLDDAFVSGTVVDKSGNPIDDGKVTVRGLQVHSTKGNYEVGLSTGNWTLEATASGYADTLETVNLTEDQEVELDITLEEAKPANFDVDIDDTNSPITEGDTLQVNVRVNNTGDLGDTQAIQLSTDGDLRDSQKTTVDGGEARTVHLSWSTETGDAGEYAVTVESEDDDAEANVTVEESIEPAFFGVKEVEAPATVEEGEEFEVTAEIANTGDRTGVQEVEFRLNASDSPLDGDAVEIMETLELEPGENRNVTFEELSIAEDGEYHHGVSTENDSVQGNLVVEEGEIGPLSDDNPFGDEDNEPVDSDTVSSQIFSWLQNQEIDGVEYERDEVSGFVFEWLQES